MTRLALANPLGSGQARIGRVELFGDRDLAAVQKLAEDQAKGDGVDIGECRVGHVSLGVAGVDSLLISRHITAVKCLVTYYG